MRRNQGDHSVATEPKPVHPIGQYEAKVEPSGAGAERKAEQASRSAGVNARGGI